jgi:drug/metabolite transporter (DMT)-like permease
MAHASVRRGQLAGLTAAVLFGCSAPLISTLTGSGSALSIAGLLYAGAGLALLAVGLIQGRAQEETPVQRQDWPALVGLTLLGGVVGPLALVLGLARLPAASSSLLLNLEAVFTLTIAVAVGREHLGKRGLLSAALTLAGRQPDRPGDPGLGHRQQPQPAAEPAQSDPDRQPQSSGSFPAHARLGSPTG